MKLTIAIAKGRLQDESLSLLARAGLSVSEEMLSTRRLSIEENSGRYRLIFVKPADVPVYVEHGIADCGVVGRDVLMESQADILQCLTLAIGYCRMVVASPPEPALRNRLARVWNVTSSHQVSADQRASFWIARHAGRNNPAVGLSRSCAASRL